MVYFKITWEQAILLEHKFGLNQTKIKGGCQLGRKTAPHDTKSDLPLSTIVEFHSEKKNLKQKEYFKSMEFHQQFYLLFLNFLYLFLNILWMKSKEKKTFQSLGPTKGQIKNWCIIFLIFNVK